MQNFITKMQNTRKGTGNNAQESEKMKLRLPKDGHNILHYMKSTISFLIRNDDF